MKLRTKILLISGIAVLMASSISGVVIWLLSRKSTLNEAVVKAYQNTFMVMSDFKSSQESNAKFAVNNYFIEYFFKRREDYYNICFRGVVHKESGKQNDIIKYSVDYNDYSNIEEIYNHTVLNEKDLINLTYRTYKNDYNSNSIKNADYYNRITYAYLDKGGKHYIVFNCDLGNDIMLFKIEDLSSVQKHMELLALSIVFITAIVTVFTISILSIILKRVLDPLHKLNDTTKHMAEGLYDQRLDIRNMDEIGQLSENFNKMADAVEIRTNSLEESEMRKTLFMGNLTHELKTPMTSISGYAQTLLTMKISDDDREEALLYIYQECGRLERLSRKMMKLLEIDHEDGLEMADISVNKLFEAAAKSCSVILKEKNISLECREQGQIFHVEADLMTDVMINLIDNAVKASKPGGKIILKAGKDYIEVQDFGKGIPLDEQDKILEPFYMIDKSRSRKSGGAGLGLALIAEIAQKHNMTLKIDSKIGVGTRMILQFV